jgi:hypothetical protein
MEDNQDIPVENNGDDLPLDGGEGGVNGKQESFINAGTDNINDIEKEITSPRDAFPEPKEASLASMNPGPDIPGLEIPKSEIPKSEIPMDVHHPHHLAHKKKLSEYLLEFFMLFLAVFLGFLTENYREHYIEKGREKQYMRSFTEDLKKDISELDSLIEKRKIREMQIDSIHYILTSPDPDQFGSQLYYYARYLPRPYLFINNDAGFKQLENSGNLRLIKNQVAADTMMAYVRQLRFIETITTREDQLIQRIFNSLNKLFDSEVFDKMNLYDIEFTRPAGNPKLMTHDKEVIRNFLSDIHYLKTVNIGQIGWFQKQRKRAETTLVFLEDEYHLR